MNSIVKTIIAYLLQLPLCCVLVNGLSALFGLNVWWCIPITIVIMVMYNIGEIIRRND